MKRNTLKKFLPQRPKGVTKGPPLLKGQLPSHQLISGTAKAGALEDNSDSMGSTREPAAPALPLPV